MIYLCNLGIKNYLIVTNEMLGGHQQGVSLFEQKGSGLLNIEYRQSIINSDKQTWVLSADSY
jgi:hypothetical protein